VQSAPDLRKHHDSWEVCVPLSGASAGGSSGRKRGRAALSKARLARTTHTREPVKDGTMEIAIFTRESVDDGTMEIFAPSTPSAR
jgi:hypothetical protein